ncbi:MAG TPA: GPW/gp25 family protein [Pyrinomonadaceae bacterium]|nr:GPW/gp25 family protein [Pyrinomonadaceae bacterium]
MANRDAEKLAPLFGRDLRLNYALSGGFFEDADLASGRPFAAVRRERDLLVSDGIDNLTQAIANRLKTRKGELASLGHPDYGSRHHELIGEPNVDRTRNLIKLYVLQALRDEPRIERTLSATVRAEHSPPRDSVRIELSLRVIGQPAPLNLVVPFSLGVGI